MAGEALVNACLVSGGMVDGALVGSSLASDLLGGSPLPNAWLVTALPKLARNGLCRAMTSSHLNFMILLLSSTFVIRASIWCKLSL